MLDMDLVSNYYQKTEIKTMSNDLSSYAILNMQMMYELFDRIFVLLFFIYVA